MEQAELLQQIEERALAEKDDSKKFFFFQEIGNAYLKAGDYSKALDYYNQALKVARKAGNRKLECDAFINIGSSLFNSGNTYDAINTYKNALTIAREIQDYRVQSLILGKLADAYLVLGENNQAIDFFHQGAVTAEKEEADQSNVEYSGVVENWKSIESLQKLLKEEILSRARFRSISIIMAALAIAIITTGITLVFQSGSEIATTAALTIVIGILTLLVSFFTVYFYRKH